MGSLGPFEVLIILVIAVLLFGGRFFKQFGAGAADAVKEWKKAFKKDDDKT